MLAVLLVLVVVGTLRSENGGDRVPERVVIGEVDVSGLDIGDSSAVGDIQLDASKYTVMTSADVAVAAAQSTY